MLANRNVERRLKDQSAYSEQNEILKTWLLGESDERRLMKGLAEEDSYEVGI
jgi:hypothetical protein